jgi:hypothetical protein
MGLQKLLLVHAVIGGIATVILLPLGVIIPRLSKTFVGRVWWIPAHGVVNGLLAGGLIIAAWAIAQSKLGGGMGPGDHSVSYPRATCSSLAVQLIATECRG